MSTSLDRVILSFPSLISLASKAGDTDAPRSWIQLAVTGNFESNRYGKFSITKADLSQMLHNFKFITPQAPTELPIDFDHLSMEAKKPGDGIAAGWLKDLELRADGTELWGLAEWTPDAATMIAKRQYRFISPSFVKDHTHKNGEKIGTTLLASALTNHPFLESMAAVTLYSFSAMGDLALVTGEDVAVHTERVTAHHLAEIAQRVSFSTDPELTPELTDEERAMTFVVKAVVGAGDDAFVRLATLDGDEFGWYRATQLVPADPEQNDSPLPSKQPKEEIRMSADTVTKAAKFEERVKALEKTYPTRQAFHLAQDADPEGATAYRLRGLGAEPDSTPEPQRVLSLSVREGESFDALAMRYATEKGVPLRVAIHEVGRARPDLAAQR